MRKDIEQLIADLDKGRAEGTIYTYGQVQERLRAILAAEDQTNADYREVFGKNPEPWRAPLGALRLTLAGDEPWTLERARGECEELTRVLNKKASN